MHTVLLLFSSLAGLTFWRLQQGIVTIHLVCRRSSSLVEIVADADRDVLLRFSDGTEVRLAVSMDLTAALQELQALGVATKPSKSLWGFGSAVTPAGKSAYNASVLDLHHLWIDAAQDFPFFPVILNGIMTVCLTWHESKYFPRIGDMSQLHQLHGSLQFQPHKSIVCVVQGTHSMQTTGWG